MLGQRLRELRTKRNLTMKELGKRFDLAESTISGYESGARKPDSELIAKFAESFEVTTDYLITGSTGRGSVDAPNVSPEEAEFLKWIDENLESSFFYDFSRSPEEQKREMMKSLRIVWVLEKHRRPGQKQGESPGPGSKDR